MGARETQNSRMYRAGSYSILAILDVQSLEIIWVWNNGSSGKGNHEASISHISIFLLVTLNTSY